MIQFKDFMPEQRKEKTGFLGASRVIYEPLSSTLERINQWIEDEDGVDVINVETVSLPNIHAPGEEGSEDTSLLIRGNLQDHWHQFVRVWYRV